MFNSLVINLFVFDIVNIDFIIYVWFIDNRSKMFFLFVLLFLLMDLRKVVKVFFVEFVLKDWE